MKEMDVTRNDHADLKRRSGKRIKDVLKGRAVIGDKKGDGVIFKVAFTPYRESDGESLQERRQTLGHPEGGWNARHDGVK